MPYTLILVHERRRRVITIVLLAIATLVYFYEYPLYGVLYIYAQYHGLTGMEPPPTPHTRDYVFLLVCFSIGLAVYLRPRSYLRGDQTGQTFEIFVKGKSAGTVSINELRRLEFKCYSERERKARSSAWRSCVKIVCVNKPAVVFYDAVITHRWWREKRIARKLGQQLGPITWKDKNGILTGRPDPAREARIKKREQQLEAIPKKQRHKAPVVVKAYGARLFFILVFATFGGTFWYNNATIPAWVFIGLAGLMVVDLILTWMGFGQKPSANKKTS